MFYYLNIGSNLGNKMLNISRAISEIEKVFGWFELSSTVESEPWGYESAHKFVNIGMLIASELSPEEVLKKLQVIEKKISPSPHRSKDGSYMDRIIDIEIMAAQSVPELKGVEISTSVLTLPHPHLQERPFFMEPYRDLLSKTPWN